MTIPKTEQLSFLFIGRLTWIMFTIETLYRLYSPSWVPRDRSTTISNSRGAANVSDAFHEGNDTLSVMLVTDFTYFFIVMPAPALPLSRAVNSPDATACATVFALSLTCPSASSYFTC